MDWRDDAATAGGVIPGTTEIGLQRLCRLAAGVAASSSSVIGLVGSADSLGPVRIAFGLPPGQIEAVVALDEVLSPGAGLSVVPDLTAVARMAAIGPPGQRFLAHLPLLTPEGQRLGFLCVLDTAPRAGLTALQAASLADIGTLIVFDCEREHRYAAHMRVIQRARRADRMLRLVSEAESCADALTSLLGELCRFHGAAVGRIWELTVPEGLMREVSRYNDDALDEHSYYRQPPREPVTQRNTMTAEAIRSNQPRAFIYSEVKNPQAYALMPGAMASGLASQVSFPIWVQEQRFGIALAFTGERADLDDIVADLASLANTIRPALFRKVTEERIAFVARHDDLTQLANRVVFQERLAEGLASAAGGEHGLALLYLDLDGFKLVNDLRGHEVGDKLLAAVAGRLRSAVRRADTIARIGGDEFAVVQIGEQPEAAILLAKRLRELINQPFEIDGQRSSIGLSVGIALYPADGETPDLLIRNADTALYRAKDAGRNTHRLYEASMDLRRQERAAIERDLGIAIGDEQFAMVYQPICATASLKVLGFEALLRWDHPVRGPIMPNQFVPLAEASGLILPLGRWALEAACTEAMTWDPGCQVSVNLSPTQFRQADLPDQIAGVLARTGLPPGRLDVEITEGLLLDDSGLVLRTMQTLKEQGIGITLDDFGTGYASLSYLRRFPFDRLKIDRSFVQGMCDDDGTQAIVQAILSLSARLNLAVVAEGVETERERDMLLRLQCPLIQGFLAGRPMTAAELRRSGRVAGPPECSLERPAVGPT